MYSNLLHNIHEQTGLRLVAVRTVGGGSIHRAMQVKDATTGTSYFLKSNSLSAETMFDTEARGLSLLSDASQRQDAALLIPRIIARGQTINEAWLLMDFLEEVRPAAENWHEMGAALARLHRDDGLLGGRFGLDHDNFIGSLAQRNTIMSDNWATFFITQRLQPQFRLAATSGRLHSGKSEDRVYTWIDQQFPAGPASILHGDLWSGNAMFAKDSQGVIKPALFDPAVYVGHAEADLAFTHLFGGFDRAFYTGYASITPVEPGFSERIDILNLYPLLVHVNLFGGGYVAQVEQIMGRV